MKVQLNNIRHPRTWNGKEPKNHSPSFDYCRKLINEGINPEEPLEVYRGDVLAYTVSSIGIGATKKIREDKVHSPHEVPYTPLDEKTKGRLAKIKVFKAPRGKDYVD